MLYNAHLDTLIRVVEAGSFRQAAVEMHISPSAVLKQIGLLEKDLGVVVFDRTRKGVTLTAAGESIYRDAKFLISFCDEARLRVQKIAAESPAKAP
ncbi:MAG: LysR family transcriptional regulator [Lachnospiraceae bacterium]|nr:LysR family transcriptional regulator [Lachnospiraceae bacterium]